MRLVMLTVAVLLIGSLVYAAVLAWLVLLLANAGRTAATELHAGPIAPSPAHRYHLPPALVEPRAA